MVPRLPAFTPMKVPSTLAPEAFTLRVRVTVPPGARLPLAVTFTE